MRILAIEHDLNVPAYANLKESGRPLLSQLIAALRSGDETQVEAAAVTYAPHFHSSIRAALRFAHCQRHRLEFARALRCRSRDALCRASQQHSLREQFLLATLRPRVALHLRRITLSPRRVYP